MPTPLYLDWTFWSFVVAAAAIVLSQLPPLRSLLHRPQLELDAYGRMLVTHLMGYPNIEMTLGVRNPGGKQVRVRCVSLSLFSQGRETTKLEGASYFPSPLPQSPSVILTPFVLAPGDERIHAVRFIQRLPQHADRVLGQLRAEVRQDLIAQLDARRGASDSAPSEELVSVNAQLAQRLDDEFARNFRWTTGEHEVVFRVETEELGMIQRRYRFTLYESDIESMREIAARHKYGFGVVPSINDDRAIPVLVDLSRT